MPKSSDVVSVGGSRTPNGGNVELRRKTKRSRRGTAGAMLEAAAAPAPQERDASFEYRFPSIRGIQARREFYVSMCPLRLIPKVFLFDEEELNPELRAQRILNRGRLPEMARYILDNPDNYVFSALTASIDGEVEFEAIGSDPNSSRIGQLRVPMDARFIINDGQHRRAAIEQALHEDPDLAHESIAVVFFVDHGLRRCQQMFADLNRHAIRPSRSIGILYDHRDDRAELARKVVLESPVFKNVVEMERTTLAKRSRKLFTLSAIYNATCSLLSGREEESFEERVAIARGYWEAVARQFPEWGLVCQNKMSGGEIRADYIHSHGIVLQSLGRVGRVLLERYPKQWKAKLKKLRSIDWSRANAELWEGRATSGGRVVKGETNVMRTTTAIKRHLGVELDPEEERLELVAEGATA